MHLKLEMVLKPLKLLIFLSCLFTFIISDEIVFDKKIFSYEDFPQINENDVSYEIKFSNIQSLKKYLHISVKSLSTKNQIVSLSTYDENCFIDRQSLGMQPNGVIHLFFIANQIQNNKIYLCIHCQGEDTCEHETKIVDEDACKLYIGEQYSYYIGDKASESMTFKFRAKRDSDLNRVNSNAALVNFWVKGEYIESTKLYDKKNYLEGKSFNNGRIYKTQYYNGTEYELTVQSQVGDYVTVGSLFIDQGESKQLKINDLEVMVLLDSELREVCFPLDTFTGQIIKTAINGLIYTKKAKFYLKDKEKIEGTETQITNGVFSEVLFISDIQLSICIEHYKYENSGFSTILSLQLTSHEYENYNQFIYAPQIPGIIYEHILFKDQIALFRGTQPKSDSKEINYNMKAIKGFPDMLFSHICMYFPFCNYDVTDLSILDDPGHTNRMTLYSFYLNEETKKFNPIFSFQPLLVVNCVDVSAYENSEICRFQTSIYSDKDPLYLIEGESYSQFLLKNEKDLYVIDIEQEENLEKIYLDLMIFSGDVYFDIDSSMEASKYFLSNKIFYSIHVKDYDKKVEFSVTASKNSFYLIQYQLVYKTKEDSFRTNTVESGVNFLESLYIGEETSLYKYIDFLNFKTESNIPYLVNFYSQNCKFIVSRKKEQDNNTLYEYISLFDNYGQIIIEDDDNDYKQSKYRFMIDITEDDSSDFNKKLCMLYVTGLELSNTNTGTERTISVSEGVPQYYIFTEKYPVIKYSYHVSDLSNTLVAQFNLIDKAPYKVTISFGDYNKETTIYRNTQLFVYSSDLSTNCKYKDEVCTVNFNIELEKKNKNRKLETTIYQINGAPTYLEKNVVKQDILIGSVRKYYFMDIGKDETGDITIDYKRGSGYINAKIVKKHLDEIQENPEWRGIYQFPKSKDESLPYETYLKKIVISSDDTRECDDGCYILITVINSVYREIEEFDEKAEIIPYRITLTPRIIPKENYDPEAQTAIPKVKILANEFVIGDVFSSEQKIYNYYTINLPYDSEYLIIDWQADKPSLFINVGNDRPGLKEGEYDFKFESVDHDTVFKLTKTQIIDKAKEKGIKIPNENSMRNIDLTLGVWTNQIDTLYTSVYAFKLFMPPSYKETEDANPEAVELIHIRSDQKVQCDPVQVGDIYLCLFAVIFDGSDTNSSLVVYPKAQDENIDIRFYGSMVDAEEIERNNMEYISQNMPVFEGEYSSNQGIKFVFEEKIDKSKCFLFIVDTEKYTIIEVLSSTYTYTEEQTIIPNPSTAQIFAIGSTKVKFNFETSQDLLINLVCVSGSGMLNWENEREKNIYYYLYGYEDRLTLTSGTDIAEDTLSSLVIQSTTISWFDERHSGFVFYVTFYPRNSEYNIDQVKAGRSTDLNYRQSKFPLNFYTRLTDKDIAISFNFYNFYRSNKDILTYDKPMLEIWGQVLRESEVLEARLDKSLKPEKNKPNTVFGVFDGAFGILYLNSESIKKFNIEDEEKPTLFFSVEMVEGIPFNFNGASVEISVLREHGKSEANLFIPEHVYLNGKITNDTPKYVYKLRTNPSNPYMHIEFSSNNKLIEYAIGLEENIESNSNELIVVENDNLNGKKIMTFQIPEYFLSSNTVLYMVVFYKGGNELDSRLGNFVFQYMNTKEKENFFSFGPKDTKIEYEITGNNNGKKSYKISFSPAEAIEGNYYIKAIYKDTQIKEEVKDTIAISESKGRYWQINNPELNDNKKLSIDLLNVEKEISYIKVLGKVDLEGTRYYYLYQPLDLNGDTPEQESIDIKPSKDIIKLNYDTQKRKLIGNANNAYKIQNYKISFNDKSNIPNYIKVESISKSERNQILYFSPSSSDCKTNRKQIGQAGKSNTVNMWIKKEQLENKDYLYTTVECQVKGNDRCSYVIEITGYDIPEIESAIFVHNYYVSEKNEQMKFKIINNMESGASEDIITLYANGGQKIKLSLTNCYEGCDQIDFKTGAAITTKIEKYSHFELTINAQKGDFISFGSKITGAGGKSLENTLVPNEYQLTGYLKKGLLDQECYSFPNFDSSDEYYLSGIFYNRIAEISFKDNNYNDINDDFYIVNKGFYSYIHNKINGKRKYICIGFPKSPDYTIQDIPYSLQLTEPTKDVGLLNIYAPQLRGVIYPRITPKGSVVFFNGANLNSDSQHIIYNMMVTEGLPKMYMYKCTSYPVCEFDYNSLDQNEDIIKLDEINRITNWYNDKEERNNSPIDAEQYIMVVKCEDLNDPATEICQFQTSIFGKDDNIFLIEGQPFSQYVPKGDKDKFTIDFDYERRITKIHLDTLVVSGDVTFTLRDENGNEIEAHKYYLANKIFYSVHKNKDNRLTRIIVDIEAKQNSYYLMEYKLVRGPRSESVNDVYEGINNLIPIRPMKEEKDKIINIHNVRSLSDSKYLTSFYSLNCEFYIERVNNNGEFIPLITYGNYGQDIIDQDSGISNTIHTYQVKVKEKDISKYPNNMCMLYVNALQITKDSNSPAQKDILIGEGVPQKTIFQNGVNKIRYIYPNANPDKNLALNFKVITPANYTLRIIYNHNEGFSSPIYRSDIIYLENLLSFDTCKENELCNVIVEIDVEEEYNGMDPIVELTLTQIGNIPYYIPKSVVKQNYVAANSSLYLFTNLGKNDEGYITIDFARGSGIVYAKVVKIDGEGDNNPDWRQYKFPQSIGESLPYDFYNKKLLFSHIYTNECENGCYLLISIQPSVKSELNEQYRFYQFSISVGLTPSGYLKEIGPLIEIEPEEYIVGSLLSEEKIKIKDMYEFYKINIPFNADFVEFDWQSDAAVLLINVGDERPTIDNHHFNYTSRSDTVFKITKDQIKEHLAADNYITNSHLTIGVYTEDIDSLYGTAYSFRVHFVNKINIYKISSDQKTLCRPEKLNDNEYRCLFMIIYNQLDFINDLMVYSKSQSSSAETYMYGKFLENSIYDSYNIDELNYNIPDENAPYNTKKEEIDFIYLTMAEVQSHFYVSAISNEPDIIEFITSMKTYDSEISPNPSTIQLFSMKEKTMKLKFLTQKGLFINIVSLHGNAKLNLESETNNYYRLRGRDDRLSLAINFYEEENTVLVVENLGYIKRENIDISSDDEVEPVKSIEKPGFAFYIEYYLRTIQLNFDEIKLGKTTEISYKETDFPLYYYSKLNNLENNINSFFILHNLEYANENENITVMESRDFSFKGSLIKQKTVYLIQRYEEIKPNLETSPFVGIYDPAINVGQVYFSADKLKGLSVKEKDQPTLYLSLEKLKNVKYKRIRLELTAYEENKDTIVTEKLYQYGKIYDKNTINSYKLKVDNSTGDIRIQFSTNSKNINFAINDEKDKKTNSTYNFISKVERGKVFVTFKKPENKRHIYLNVFLKDDSKSTNPRSNNYVFKYINSKSRKLFFEYPILNNKSSITKIVNKKEKHRCDIEVKFNRIEKENINVIYSLKVARRWEHSSEELNPSIALSDIGSRVVQSHNPKGDEITMKINNIEDNYSYLEVIAQIIDGPIIEYVAYEPSYNDIRPPNDNNKDNKNNTNQSNKSQLWIIITLSSIIGIIIIVLVTVVCVYHRKNKDLLKTVNTVSFAEEGAKGNGNENLLYDKNELL